MGKFIDQKTIGLIKKEEAIHQSRRRKVGLPDTGNRKIVVDDVSGGVYISSWNSAKPEVDKSPNDDIEKMIRLGFCPKTSFRNA